MKAKLIKTGVGSHGKYRGKTCYEYGLHDDEDLAKITRDYTERTKEYERMRRMNPHRRWGPLPRLNVPSMGYAEIDDCKHEHRDETVIGVVNKTNGNVQIWVENAKGQEPEPAPFVPVDRGGNPLVRDPEPLVPHFINCPVCGKEVKPKGLKAHQTRWCKGEAA